MCRGTNRKQTFLGSDAAVGLNWWCPLTLVQLTCSIAESHDTLINQEKASPDIAKALWYTLLARTVLLYFSVLLLCSSLFSFITGFFFHTVQELLFFMLHTSESWFISVYKVLRKAKMKKENERLSFQFAGLIATNPM